MALACYRATGGLPLSDAAKRRYELRADLAPYQPFERLRNCGQFLAYSPEDPGGLTGVEIVMPPDGHPGFRGVETCGSKTGCPPCSARACVKNAEEIKRAVAWARATGLTPVMATFSFAHGQGDDLKKIRGGCSEAWRLFRQGAPFLRFKCRVGLVHSVRALECTCGRHGFHPHIHAILFVRDVSALRAALPWISDRWCAKVTSLLGPEHAPNVEHGVVLSECDRDGVYLAKLGLEVGGAGAGKRAKNGNRSMWEVAEDLAEHRAPADVAIWRAYVTGMRGARMLTWSVGLRAAVRVWAASEAVKKPEDSPGMPLSLALVPSPAWYRVRARRDIWRLLTAAVDGQIAEGAGQWKVNRQLLAWGIPGQYVGPVLPFGVQREVG